jgi:aryl-alcohol dehydrogenase-like predicted oxidoreductase
MVGRCLDAGINCFDTANVYNRGAAEIILGQALGAKRHQVIVATKVFGKTGDSPDDSGLSRDATQRS